ncbi:MAG: aspartyl protease family protein [Acidobacteriota bacterium]
MRKSTAWLFKVSITVAFVASALASDADRSRVPFTLEGGHLIVVKGAIGGLHELNFVIDTGASSVVVSRQVAKKLNLKGTAKKVLTYGRKANVRLVDLPSVKVGDTEFDVVSALVGPLAMPGLDRPFRVDALIGLDLLKRTSLTIDFASCQIFFGPVAHSGASFSFYAQGRIVTAPVTVRGEHLSLMFDTGAEHLILFQGNVEGRVAMKRTDEKKDIRYMGGKARLSGIRLPEVKMSETQWDDLPAYLLDGPKPDKHLDGILGIASLGLTRLNLDFDNNRISWER